MTIQNSSWIRLLYYFVVSVLYASLCQEEVLFRSRWGPRPGVMHTHLKYRIRITATSYWTLFLDGSVVQSHYFNNSKKNRVTVPKEAEFIYFILDVYETQVRLPVTACWPMGRGNNSPRSLTAVIVVFHTSDRLLRFRGFWASTRGYGTSLQAV